MRDRGRQLAERRQLLGLNQLRLCRLQLGRAIFHLVFERVGQRAQFLLRRAQRARHVVERRGEDPQFVAAAHLDLLLQVAPRNLLRAELETMAATPGISRGLHELLANALQPGADAPVTGNARV